MKLFYRKTILKFTLVFLTISVFYTFFLKAGDLFASQTWTPQEAASQTFSSQSQEQTNEQLSANTITFDFLVAEFSENGQDSTEPLDFKKVFLVLGSLKESSQCVVSSEIMPLDSLPAYFFSSLKI